MILGGESGKTAGIAHPMLFAKASVTFSWSSCIAKHNHERTTNWCVSPGRVLARSTSFFAHSSNFTIWLGARNGISILIHCLIQPRTFCRIPSRKNVVKQDSAHGCLNVVG